jgi:hypothetical protein
MFKFIKFFIFVNLLMVTVHHPLLAVGGEGVEEVSDAEIKRKGILLIHRHGNSAMRGTGVLFFEGEGQLGLGAKHSFLDFKIDKPMVAYLGEENRDIVYVYRSSDQNIDLALFILRSPFKNIENLPHLPSSQETASVYEGDSYGCGVTTSSTHPGYVVGSIGKCRKGKQFIAAVSSLGAEMVQSLLKFNQIYSAKDYFSFTINQQESQEPRLPALEGININKNSKEREDFLRNLTDTITQKQSINFAEGTGSLTSSPSYSLTGDSGGPLIGSDNQLYALTAGGTARYDEPVSVVDSVGMVELGKRIALSTGEDPRQALISHAIPIRSKHEIIYSETQELFEGNFFMLRGYRTLMMVVKKAGVKGPIPENRDKVIKFVHDYLEKDLEESIIGSYGRETLVHKLVKMEENLPAEKRYGTRWLNTYLLYRMSTFMPLIGENKAWVERVLPKAFAYIETNKLN